MRWQWPGERMAMVTWVVTFIMMADGRKGVLRQGRRMSGSWTAERRHDCRDASVLDTGSYHDRGDDYRLQSKLTEISFRKSGQRKSRANKWHEPRKLDKYLSWFMLQYVTAETLTARQTTGSASTRLFVIRQFQSWRWFVAPNTYPYIRPKANSWFSLGNVWLLRQPPCRDGATWVFGNDWFSVCYEMTCGFPVKKRSIIHA